jgi:hypothetical protein
MKEIVMLERKIEGYRKICEMLGVPNFLINNPHIMLNNLEVKPHDRKWASGS